MRGAAAVLVLTLMSMRAVDAQALPSLYIVQNATAEEFGAKCLDGTPPAYYFSPATNASLAHTWVLFFKGGGWAYTVEDAYYRSLTTLGSSNNLTSTYGYDGGPTSPIQADNPLFAGANRAILWYCSGDSFSGWRSSPLTYEGKQIWVRGAGVLRAILHELTTLHGLGSAQEVLLSGGSAGGLAAYLHADTVRSLLPPSVEKYAVAPDSGFFLNHTNVLGQYVYGADMASAFDLYNASAGLDASCIAAGHGAACFFAPVTYNYVESRIFVMNSAVDSWQMQCIFTATPFESCSAAPGWGSCAANYTRCNSTQVQAMVGYEQDFLSTLRASPTWSKDGNGGFIYSCVSHVASESSSFWTGITIDGTSYVDAFNAWWLSSPQTPASQNQHLPCTLHSTAPYRCNPTCFPD